MRVLPFLALLIPAPVVAAEPPAPKPDELAALVRKLGSEDFAEREAAAKKLEDVGPAAVDALRAGAKSENPETRRRALDLLRAAERRLANEKALSPTLVELDFKKTPLDDVLAELSRQARCVVVVGGVEPAKLAGEKVTVSTGGKVPFWEAVLKVCDAADAQIASAAGFSAPGAMPPAARPAGSGFRRAADPNSAVILEQRDATRRPAAVYGAVLVEAPRFPKSVALDQPSALLQVWPEPRLQWKSTAAVKVTRATDADGARLAVEYAAPYEAPVISSNGTAILRNPDGTAKLVRLDPNTPFQLPGEFRPHVRQAVIRFKPGDKPPAATADLSVSLFGTVRCGLEPLSRAAIAGPNQPAAGKGTAASVSATYHADAEGKLLATVELAYEPNAVTPAAAGDDLHGVRGGDGFGNNCVGGVRVTDADGKPYTLGLLGGESSAEPGGKWVKMRLRLELHPDRDGHGPPAAVTFWGTYARPVEVPVRLKDVVLSRGK